MGPNSCVLSTVAFAGLFAEIIEKNKKLPKIVNKPRSLCYNHPHGEKTTTEGGTILDLRLFLNRNEGGAMSDEALDTLSATEKARIIYHSRHAAQADKHRALQEIIDTLPDETVQCSDFTTKLAEDISLALRSKRVDNMRDALNLAIREDERRKEAEARQRALERQIEDEQEAQMEMQRIAQQQAEEEARHNAAMERAQEQARWEAEQSRRAAAEEARREQQAAEDAARQEKWAAQAEARRAEARSRNAY